MVKTFVYISGIIITAVFSITQVNQPYNIVYSSSLSSTITPTSIEGQVSPDRKISSVERAVPVVESEEIEVLPAKVIEVLAIDTLRIKQNAKIIDIHLIGVGRPTDEQLRRYYNQHEEKLLQAIQNMLKDTTVYVVNDYTDNQIELASQDRYVFLKDMTFLNIALIQNGMAPADVADKESFIYKSGFEKAEQESKNEQRGIWSKAQTPPVMGVTQKKIITTPRFQPSPTSIPAASPTSTPIPTSTPFNTPTPRPAAKIQSSSLNTDTILSLINAHRSSKNLSPMETHDELCKIAQARAPQLYDEIFVTKNVHAGFYNMNIPYWMTENMAHYGSEEKILQWWLGSTIHRNAIEGDYKYSCGACSGNSCAQLFTNFTPKS